MSWLGCWIVLVLAFSHPEPWSSSSILTSLYALIAAFHLQTYGFGKIEDSAARQTALLYSSTGAPPTWTYFLRPTPAATCSSHLRLPYRLLAGSGHPSLGRSPGLPLRIRGLLYMKQWALYQQLLAMQTTSRV